MKRVIIISIISVFLALSVCAFFLINKIDNNSLIPGNSSYSQEQNNGKQVSENTTNLEETPSNNPAGAVAVGGGSSGGSDEGVADNANLDCIHKSIGYSLGNFKGDIGCLEDSGGKCVKLSAICSVDVHSIDENMVSDFLIEYALVDTSGNDLDTVQIEKNVNSSAPVEFSANFTIEDSGGIDVLSKCTPRILNISKKEVCN